MTYSGSSSETSSDESEVRLSNTSFQKEIPDFVEKTIGDVLFYFKDSPTRRDRV